MNILVYGGKGWIGQQFIDIVKTKTDVTINTGKARANNYNQLLNDILEYKPTHIVSFIGRTHGKINDIEYSTIDYLEQEGKLKENIRDNLFSPLLLAKICSEKNIHFTYMGTGCIFKYDESHPYEKEENGFKEQDTPNFFGSSYSIVKGATDQLMFHLNDENCLNIRIRMPITNIDHPRNFITKIINYEKICSIKNSMTVLPEILPIIFDMMVDKHVGTFNMTNPGLISHNEILTMYKEIVDPSFTWKNFTIEEQREILDSDRSNNYLNTEKISFYFPNIKNIKDSVKIMLQNWKKRDIIPKKNNFLSKTKNILVTGGCGFIGSNFINIFYDRYPNINIINFDALYYCANIDNIRKDIQNSKRYTFVKGNLTSSDIVTYVLTHFKIDTVIHFAAQSHVQNSFDDSLQYTKDNVLGTHNLLECCRIYGKIIRFVHVSTDEVYGQSLLDVTETKKTEQSLLCPTNPYAASKAAAEAIVQSYIQSFNMPIIITRGNNVYGPNQYPEKVIPKFIQQLYSGRKITIQGDGCCVRGFLHVNDTVDAFIKILEDGKINEIYNIGCDEVGEISIFELAKKIHKICKIKTDFKYCIEYIKDRPFNDKRYYISNSKLKKLGWNIKINLDTGLKMLLENK